MDGLSEIPLPRSFVVAEPIEDDDLRLTPLQLTDAQAMITVLGDPELYVCTGGRPPSIAELLRQYARQAVGVSPDGSQLWLNWIIREHGQPRGYVQATVIEHSGELAAETAWVVGVPWQGRGLATRSAKLMCSWLNDRGITRLTAAIHPKHAASRAVATRVGMRKTGVATDDGEIIWQMSSASAGAVNRSAPVSSR